MTWFSAIHRSNRDSYDSVHNAQTCVLPQLKYWKKITKIALKVEGQVQTFIDL